MEGYELFVQTASDLEKYDLNTYKLQKFYLRNYLNLSELTRKMIEKSTAFNFTEKPLTELQNSPDIYISETEIKTQDSYDRPNVIMFRTYPYHNDEHSSSGYQAFGYDPSFLIIKLTFDELKNLGKLNFEIKKS
jgi:hypothetical protein